jgi:hypothetical protein
MRLLENMAAGEAATIKENSAETVGVPTEHYSDVWKENKAMEKTVSQLFGEAEVKAAELREINVRLDEVEYGTEEFNRLDELSTQTAAEWSNIRYAFLAAPVNSMDDLRLKLSEMRDEEAEQYHGLDVLEDLDRAMGLVTDTEPAKKETAASNLSVSDLLQAIEQTKELTSKAATLRKDAEELEDGNIPDFRDYAVGRSQEQFDRLMEDWKRYDTELLNTAPATLAEWKDKVSYLEGSGYSPDHIKADWDQLVEKLGFPEFMRQAMNVTSGDDRKEFVEKIAEVIASKGTEEYADIAEGFRNHMAKVGDGRV